MNDRKGNYRENGFTLIEISVVVLIIGIIVSFIIGGKTYIENAQVQAVVRKLHNFESSRMAFRDKYHCTPGDCLTATSYGFTTNGDGDGYITDRFTPKASRFQGEIATYWRHLSQARMLDEELGSNNQIPPVGINEAYFTIMYENTNSVTGNKYVLGATEQQPRTINRTIYPWMMYSIDAKLDDGMPKTGFVVAYDQISISAAGAITYTTSLGSRCSPLFTNPVIYDLDRDTNECVATIKFRDMN